MITECGIFGCISSYKNEFNISQTINGLDLLQHRGRESAGVSYYKDGFHLHKRLGLVKDVFTDLIMDPSLPRVDKCIGHVRYSTSGKIENVSDIEEDHIQPLIANACGEEFSIVYNGNIKNLSRMKEKFDILDGGNIKIDSHMIISIIQHIKKSTLREKLIEFMKNVNGVFCLLVMTAKGIYCLRDSYGVRPLCFSGLRSNEQEEYHSYCISSESCALQDYEFIREVEPGEILFFGRNKMGDTSFHMKEIFQLKRKSQNIQKCIFEYIYFMNKNSKLNHKTITDIRFEVGQKIATRDIELFFNDNFNIANALVCGCPQTGIEYGLGYAEKSGIRYMQFLQKKQNCGRTFILPENNSRIVSCKKNLFIEGNIAGRDVILLDDSLVRGNTITTVIKKLREHGARSIHIRITSPPVKYPCFFGVDIPTRGELIASSYNVEEIKQIIDADSLTYISLDMMKESILNGGGGGEGGGDGFCSACFDGNYKQDLLDW